MKPRSVSSFETMLPSTEQLMLAPERAALDVSLELATRLLLASHVDLFPSGRRSRDPDYEPHTADLLPVAERLVRDARRLRRTIAAYCTTEDELLHPKTSCCTGVALPTHQDPSSV